MKKLMIGLMVGLTVGLMGFARAADVSPEQAALNAAIAMQIVGGWSNPAPAQAVFEKVPTDFPAATADIKARARVGIAISLYRQGKAAEAQAVLEKSLKDYPTVSAACLWNTKHLLVCSLNSQSKYAETQTASEDFLKDQPAAFDVRWILWLALDKQGKISEAQTARMAYVRDNVWTLGAKEGGAIWRSFEQITPATITADVYKQFLSDTLKATKAVDENAKFLGRIKSELAKMQ